MPRTHPRPRQSGFASLAELLLIAAVIGLCVGGQAELRNHFIAEGVRHPRRLRC